MKTTYTTGEQIGALLLIIFLAALTGTLVGISREGWTVPYFNWKIKPLCTKVRFPPILAMIIMGCIAGNFFGSVVKPFNN
jgi:uncharacterized ion transporter superfamily protein YfcC